MSDIIKDDYYKNTLRDSSSFEERKTEKYRKEVLIRAKSFLPNVSEHDLACTVLSDSTLTSQLQLKINKALKYRKSSLSPSEFFEPKLPEATIIIPSLIYRDSLSVDEIKNELDKYRNGQENKFNGKTDWVHNNLIDCILQLYAPYSRSCPFYSGFNSYCKLAHGNIRHFLELCYKSIYITMYNFEYSKNSFASISTDEQAEGAKIASTSLLNEVRTFGEQGNNLHIFVQRLGSIFELARDQSGKNITEQNHFTITSGDKVISAHTSLVIIEALKYSVLFETKSTKAKNEYDPDAIEYVLNPIYSPYFHISYRKKRKLELSINDLEVIINGSVDSFKALLKAFTKKWIIDEDNINPSLFSFLEDN